MPKKTGLGKGLDALLDQCQKKKNKKKMMC